MVREPSMIPGSATAIGAAPVPTRSVRPQAIEDDYDMDGFLD